MKNSFWLVFWVLGIAGSYAQNITATANETYYHYNTSLFNLQSEHNIRRVFTLDSGNIVTINTDELNYKITKWTPQLQKLSELPLEVNKKRIFYRSNQYKNTLYLFYYDVETEVVKYGYVLVNCEGAVMRTEQKETEGFVPAFSGTVMYYLTNGNTKIIAYDLKENKIINSALILSVIAKEAYCQTDFSGHYIVLKYVKYLDDKMIKKMSEVYAYNMLTGTISKLNADFSYKGISSPFKFKFTAKGDSLFFLAAEISTKGDSIDYKMVAFDSKLNKEFLNKSASVLLYAKQGHKSLKIVMFDYNEVSNRLLLITQNTQHFPSSQHYQMEGLFKPGTKFVRTYEPVATPWFHQTVTESHVRGDMIFIAFDVYGRIQNYQYFKKYHQAMADQSMASVIPKAIKVNGYYYIFHSFDKPKTFSVAVLDPKGNMIVHKEGMFGTAIPDSKYSDTAYTEYIGNNTFSFLAIPNTKSKKASMYLFQVNK